jgi:hypothetical protein
MVLAAHRILFLLAGGPVNCSSSRYGRLAETSNWYRTWVAMAPLTHTELGRKILRLAKRVCRVSGTDPPALVWP